MPTNGPVNTCCSRLATPRGVARTEDELVAALTTGIKPDQTPLGEAMPWQEFNAANNQTELRAIYAYLVSIAH